MKETFMSEEIERKVIAYQPRCLTEEQWADWGDSILDVVRTLSPTKVGDAQRTLSLLARYARDLDSWGHSPPIGPLFTRRLIERHIRPFGNEGARRARRSALVAVGRVANPDHPWPNAMQKLGRSSRLPPYTDKELRSLHEAARHQQPRSLRRVFQMHLALMLGLGCDRRNLFSITPEMVVRSGNSRVRVTVDGRPELEVSGLHGQWIAYWAANTEPGRPVAGPKSVTNGKLHTLVGDDLETRINTARLRTTFVVHLLNQRLLSIPEVLQLTGFKGLTSVDLYALHLDPADPEVAGRVFATLPTLYGDE